MVYAKEKGCPEMKEEKIPTRNEVLDAAISGNKKLLKKLAGRGADLNEIENGEVLLEDIMSELYNGSKPYKYTVVRLMLELGADPNVLGEEKSSPMTPAMLEMDTRMLKILLDAGADPNLREGFCEYESFYDWAEFDYRFETYDRPFDSTMPPDKAEKEDMEDADAWLKFLDRVAVKHGLRRPDHLFLLRKYGAKTRRELED